MGRVGYDLKVKWEIMARYDRMKETSADKRIRGRRLNVMFGDFCYYNRHTLSTRYTPLSIGLISQYTTEQFDNDVDVSLFKSAEKFLDQAAQNPPDVVGLAVYYWNTDLDRYVVNRLREMFGNDVMIILGGPSIDSDEREQHKFLSTSFPNADAIVVDEGELGFCNIVRRALGDLKTVFSEPIDGATFLDGDQVVMGLPVGLTLDLSTLGSPYLSGLMDDFLDSHYQPLIQTSRFCPYTCAFCVSGKNRGKLRGYPIEQIEEELRYVSKKYADRPHHTLFLADENFGILARDTEIAECIQKCKVDLGFPQSVFFYNDKRFTDTSRSVIEILGDINHIGLTLALQTENPETLKAINRRNVTEEEIESAMSWASERDISTTTELIFGLPHETRDSFVDLLDRSVKRGFDTVLCHNLFVMDGIELNRSDARKKYGIKTKYRCLGTNYGAYDDTFFVEHEEVVVATDSFSYQDFLEIRGLNFMFYSVFALNFQKWFFHFVRHQGFSLPHFFSEFVNPDRGVEWPEGYIRVLDDFKAAVEGEHFDSRAKLVARVNEIFVENNNDVGDPTRINVNFGSRLIYLECDWVKPVLLRHLDRIVSVGLSSEDRNVASSLITLAERERIDLRTIGEKEPLVFSYDVVHWRKNKFKEPLSGLEMPPKLVRFSVEDSLVSQINGFREQFAPSADKDFYYAAMDFIVPRSNLLHDLTYDGI